jgi:hypothetical protein
LSLINVQEEYKAELNRTPKEKSEEDTKKQEAQITRANDISKGYVQGFLNIESF